MKIRHVQALIAPVGLAIGLILNVCAGATDFDLDRVLALVDRAPQDTEILVLVPSLLGMSEKLTMIDQQLDLNLQDFSNALAQIKRTIGLKAGMDDEGPAMVSLVIDDETSKFEALLFLPVIDYGAMVNPRGADSSGTVSPIKLATNHTAYVKRIDGFAVLGRERETVEAYRVGPSVDIAERLGVVGRQAIESDFALILCSLDRTLMKLIDSPQLIEIIGQAGNGASTNLLAQIGTQTVNSSREQIDAQNRVLSQTDAVVLGIDVTDQGISVNLAVQLKANSEMANAIGLGGSAADALARMPQMNYLGTFAINFEGIDLTQLDHSGRTDRSIVTPSALVYSVISQVGRDESGVPRSFVQVAYASPNANLSAPSNIMFVDTDDPKSFVRALRAKIEAINDEQTSAVYVPNQMELGKHRADQFVISQQDAGADGSPPSLGSLDMIGLAMGSEMSGYVFTLDEGVLLAKTNDTTLLRAVLKSLDQDNGLGSNGPMTVSRERLPEEASVEGYVDLRTVHELLSQSILPMMQKSLLSPPFDMAPIAVGIKMQEGGALMRLYIPSSVVDYANNLISTLRGEDDSDQDRRRDRRIRQPRRGRGVNPFGSFPSGF